MTRKVLLLVLLAVALMAGAAGPAVAGTPSITLRLNPGFYEGQKVFYVNTEASDPGLAAADGTTFVPKLGNAIAAGATADLFHVTNFTQPNVLDAVPYPVGPANSDPDYSPLWQIHLVTWSAGSTPRTLRSEDEVRAAEAAGELTVEATNIVVNCSVVHTPTGGTLPSAQGIEIQGDGGTIRLPLIKGFANDNTIFYINTDASDPGVAAHDGTNFVRKLANAHESGAEADLYPFAGKANPAQRTVVDSAPSPVGPSNSDFDYSPLWDVVPVAFTDQTRSSYPLVTSEAQLYALVASGQMTAGPEPGIIVNCPIVRVGS